MSDRIALWPIVERPDLAGCLPADVRACDGKLYMMKGCSIIVANEPQGWHLSIGRDDRDPTWDEIATARYRLLPDVRDMAMLLPPLSEYVNVHRHVFHLHEADTAPAILRVPREQALA